MKTEIVKFCGNDLACIEKEGQILVVVKSICDALDLDNDWHIRAISDDEVLGAERCEHTVQVGTDQPRKMICLPLEFIHGWLFQIKFTNTMSEETKEKLIAYKRSCYKILFNHFFGNIKRQLEANAAEIALLEEINELNEVKNRAASDLKDRKLRLEKIRAERLQNEPTLFE